MSKILFFLLALFSASLHAFQLSDAMIDAEVIKVNNVVSADSNGIKVNVTGKGYKASAPYFNTNTVVPKKTFMSHVKGNLSSLSKRNVWYAGWFATMAAAGWAIDELHNQVSATTKKSRGDCFKVTGGFALMANNVSVSQCVDVQKKSLNSGTDTTRFQLLSVSPAQSSTVNGKERLSFKATFLDGWTGNPNWVFDMYVEVTSTEAQTEPVTDDSLHDSLISHMLQNPFSAAQAFMQPGANPYPYPQLFPDPLKYIPGVSEADYPLLDCYFKGTLQSTNPGGACYATQAETDRIKALGEQIKVSTSTGGQVDQANDELTKPLTQAQLEESLNKLEGADVNKVTDDASKIYDEGFKQLNDSIVGDSLPGMPDLIPIPQFHTGSCRSIPINFNLAGVSVTKQFPGETGCAQFEKMKEFLGWLMAVGVAIGLMFAALREAN